MIKQTSTIKTIMQSIIVLHCIVFFDDIFAKIVKKKIGEIIQIDYITNMSQVNIYDREIFEVVKGKAIWLVLDEKEEVIARFNITRKTIINNIILLNGYFTDIKRRLYIGLSIAFEQPAREEPILPDAVKPQKDFPSNIFNQKDQSILVLVPKGNFVYGSNIIGEIHYTSPAQRELDTLQKVTGKKRVNYISLPSFYIDAYEMTNNQFSHFLKETGTKPPPNWKKNLPPKQPVDRVSYEQADRYCAWAGKRLLTELEWEKAARGANLRVFRNREEELQFLENPKLYSIGQDFDPNICITRESGFLSPLPVDSLKDDSFFKTRDGLHVKGLCGNVSEWTSSWLLPYRGNTIPNIMYGRRFKVIKGGSYDLNKKWAKAYNRRIGGIPDLQSDYKAGFRCALNAK